MWNIPSEGQGVYFRTVTLEQKDKRSLKKNVKSKNTRRESDVKERSVLNMLKATFFENIESFESGNRLVNKLLSLFSKFFTFKSHFLSSMTVLEHMNDGKQPRRYTAA